MKLEEANLKCITTQYTKNSEFHIVILHIICEIVEEYFTHKKRLLFLCRFYVEIFFIWLIS